MRPCSWKLLKILTILISLITIVFNWRWTIGFLVGTGMCLLLYRRNETYWSDILDSGTTKGSRYMFHFAINFLLMALPMVLAALFPQIMNIFAVALGLLMIKITVTVEVLLPKRKGGNAITE